MQECKKCLMNSNVIDFTATDTGCNYCDQMGSENDVSPVGL